MVCLFWITTWETNQPEKKWRVGRGKGVVQHVQYCTDANSMSLFGYGCEPYSFVGMVHFTFPFNIYNVHKITLNAINYYSHTFSLVIFTFIIMDRSWFLILYYYSIYCWALSMYSYQNHSTILGELVSYLSPVRNTILS